MFFFHFAFCPSFLLFGLRHLSDAGILLRNMVQPFVFTGEETLWTLLVFATPLMLMECVEEKAGYAPIVTRWSRRARLACYAAVALSIVLCGAVTRNAFIYFQF